MGETAAGPKKSPVGTGRRYKKTIKIKPMTEEISLRPKQESVFSNIQMFENAQRMAKVLVQSSLVPQAYKNNIPNAMIALEMANRIGISPFMVMQNLDIIQGKPSWSSTFTIAVLNSCGRFEPLRFEFSGEGDDYGCRAVTRDMDGKELKGSKIDWKMVKAEGWLNKSGSKWKTMPEQMFQYRAASFFGRLYAPDLLKGMHSADEVIDLTQESQQDRDDEKESHRFLKFLGACETSDQLAELLSRTSDSLKEKHQAEIEEVNNQLLFNEETK